jgi:phage-related minor tail protein
MWEIGVAMVKFFSFLGPFAPVAAAGAMVGVTALVNKMRKGFASGGYTGDGDKQEEAGVVHRGEVVLESGIVKGQLPEILKLRSLLQKGIKIKDIIAQPIMNSIPNINYQPQMAFAGGGYAGGGSSFTDELKAIKDSILALNQNLINKNMTANVQITTTDPGLKVRSDKIATDRLRLRGESI